MTNIILATDTQAALSNYVLHLADTNLILAQRLCAWCGHGPILEQDIALSNIGLDLLGQTRSLYQYATTLAGDNKTEDDLAFLRNERQFKNLLLVEQPNGDFGYTVLRQFLYEAYQLLLLGALQNSTDSQLAAIAEKSLKEATYHYKWSAEWVIRLGDGTEESHQRMQHSLHEIWTYTGEMFLPSADEKTLALAGSIPDPATLKEQWFEKVSAVLTEATLEIPAITAWMQQGGKTGMHSEHLGFILAEMQYLQRQYPGEQW
jgi:ring-1,2-phenylacetyl-CoA epoxidase subunit PaaC